MTFLAIIIAVLLFQAWGSAARVHRDGWFLDWQARVTSWGLSSRFSLALLVALPCLLASLLLGFVKPLLFGLVWLPLAVLLLLYSFGRGDFQASMGRYRSHAYSGDFEAAYLTAREEFRWEDSEDTPETASGVHTLIQQAFLCEGLQRWFSVLFYFAVLGPVGALAYRLIHLGRDQFGPAAADRCVFLLDWIPARLLAATFALTGDFIGSKDSLLSGLGDPAREAGDLLLPVGLAALGPDASSPSGEAAVFGPDAAAQNREFDALLSRSAVCWIVVLSLLVLLF